MNKAIIAIAGAGLLASACASDPYGYNGGSNQAVRQGAIGAGLGASILPESMARRVLAACPAWRSRIVEPAIEAPLALCQSDHLPLSEPALAVKEILLELAERLPGASMRPAGKKVARRT